MFINICGLIFSNTDINDEINFHDTMADNKENIVRSDREWKEQLTEEQYYVTRQKGTEPAFSGRYWNEKGKGSYHCVCCGRPLFSSQAKFDSGSGWPSFTGPIDPTAVKERPDNSLEMRRTEVLCSRCGAHLGHAFDDGPQPTGRRSCINSTSLNLEKEE